MKRITAITGACALSLTVAMATSVSVRAEETQCTTSLGAVTVDNLFVPDGASCALQGTTVKGNIVVGRGASLRAFRVNVNGNVQAEGALDVAVSGNSSVGGSIQIVQGLSATLDRVRVNGDVLFDDNRAAIASTSAYVGGSLQAFQNTGGVSLNRNVIKGNLQCKENTPAPTGGGNRASSKEDQCSAL